MAPEPLEGIDQPDDRGALAAHRAFYAAFEARDLDAMSDLWRHDAAVTCVHPGWPALHGWASVAASWASLFGGSERLQFILTDERLHRVGDVCWATVDENIIQGAHGATVNALNVFEWSDGRWWMVAHHGSPVAARGGEGQ
ncbi:MAG: nuclear transport factor 2 family protein [Acidimicrobiales bacterium]|nr:nuclear transport factor 2 family protein [Acidimicrobiales bacterium]